MRFYCFVLVCLSTLASSDASALPSSPLFRPKYDAHPLRSMSPREDIVQSTKKVLIIARDEKPLLEDFVNAIRKSREGAIRQAPAFTALVSAYGGDHSRVKLILSKKARTKDDTSALLSQARIVVAGWLKAISIQKDNLIGVIVLCGLNDAFGGDRASSRLLVHDAERRLKNVSDFADELAEYSLSLR